MNDLTFEPVKDTRHSRFFENGWDWKMGNKDTLKEYLETKIGKPDNHYYWIEIDNIPVGILGLNIHPDHKQWQTIIYLQPENRKQNINETIHATLIHVFEEKQTPLIASIDISNIRSIKSFQTMLGKPGRPVHETTLNRKAILHQLVNPIQESEARKANHKVKENLLHRTVINGDLSRQINMLSIFSSNQTAD